MSAKYRVFMGDFETTVYEGQTNTEVWASACVELYTEDVAIFNCIAQQYDYFVGLNTNLICYYHNLKFDGTFWLSYLLGDLKYCQATNKIGDTEDAIEWQSTKEMHNHTVKYTISDMGQWYTIVFKIGDHIIELRDSLKLLPFSVKRIGQSFGTKHKKLDMEYKGYRYAGCEITEEEKQYIANDVLVVKEALEIMFEQGHNKLTIGACCLEEFKKGFDKYTYKELFPDLYETEINEKRYGSKTVGDYVRRSYKGGWCYLVKGKENKIFTGGTTADVNSLYPSMMSSESGNRYPVGRGQFWRGNYLPICCHSPDFYYFVRIKTRFYIKPNKLPFIQIKHTRLYDPNECLETSDVYNKATGEWVKEYRIGDEYCDGRVELTLTKTDFELVKEHYELVDFEILDGCIFHTEIGLFDEYMQKYKKIKAESKGAKRESAKLFLNNLYGKMASNKNSSFKYAFIKENGALGFRTIVENNKKAGYIPIGSAITSYARCFTIRAAQANYHGVNQRGFIYADTDSIHCDLPPEQIKGIKVHDTDFCCWKLESYWDKAIFVRAKTYIEHNTHADGELLPEPWYNVKCAGMPEKCKALFIMSMTQNCPQDKYEKLNEYEKEFISQKRDLTDFKIGLIIHGKLMPKRIKGGTILCDTTYQMR